MTNSTKPTKQEVLDWLKATYNRYANGQCTTRACMLRGGYNGPTDAYEQAVEAATCEAHEAVRIIESAPE